MSTQPTKARACVVCDLEFHDFDEVPTTLYKLNLSMNALRCLSFFIVVLWHLSTITHMLPLTIGNILLFLAIVMVAEYVRLRIKKLKDQWIDNNHEPLQMISWRSQQPRVVKSITEPGFLTPYGYMVTIQAILALTLWILGFGFCYFSVESLSFHHAYISTFASIALALLIITCLLEIIRTSYLAENINTKENNDVTDPYLQTK